MGLVDALHERLEPLGAAGDGDHVGAVLRKGRRQVPADAGGGACHHHHAPAEAEVRRKLERARAAEVCGKTRVRHAAASGARPGGPHARYDLTPRFEKQLRRPRARLERRGGRRAAAAGGRVGAHLKAPAAGEAASAAAAAGRARSVAREAPDESATAGRARRADAIMLAQRRGHAAAARARSVQERCRAPSTSAKAPSCVLRLAPAPPPPRRPLAARAADPLAEFGAFWAAVQSSWQGARTQRARRS